MNEEQRAAMQQMAEETRDFQPKIIDARTALFNAVYADKVDEAAIKEKAAALAKIEADFDVARAKAFDKVRSKFSPEQVDALKRISSTGLGGRGGGMGGARRGGGGGAD
jgi:protein CpxP